MPLDLKSITENYRERIQRLALFDPLYKLENKKGKDRSNKSIDYFSLGLLTLLFFFENMLLRNRKNGVKELTDFLFRINQGKINLDYGEFEKIARNIIETFRPPGGKRNFRQFYNWETRQEDIVQYSILKADKWDAEKKVQYYTLAEQGLELVFATKEFFSEFQLSINQLVLRKQLEKGEFVSALRQIDEMRVDVETLQERMLRIKQEITRNIISDEIYLRYKNIVEDINRRLGREHEEFEELQSFVRETKKRLEFQLNSEKEKKAYELILQIDRELGEVHYIHGQLFQESIGLKTTALQAAQESLYYVGIDSFNFEQEITTKLMSSPLPLKAARTLIEPFLFMQRRESWSPLVVFGEQRIEGDKEKSKTNAFSEPSEEENEQKYFKILGTNFSIIMQIILEVLGEREEITLAEVVDYLKDSPQKDLLEKRFFYAFWLILHQRSPLKCQEEEENLFYTAMQLAKSRGNTLVVQETQGIVEVTPRYRIKNMKLRWESSADDLQ